MVSSQTSLILLILTTALLVITQCQKLARPFRNIGIYPIKNKHGGTFKAQSIATLPKNMLTYRGGKVNSAAQVVQVLWGAGTYDPSVTSTAAPSLASFYEQLMTNGAMTSWLNSEYKTPTQTISTGSFVGIFTINPFLTSTSIFIENIGSELLRQIIAGNLPAPELDAAGNPKTYYSVILPHEVTIDGQCTVYCAFHGSVPAYNSYSEFSYALQYDFSFCPQSCSADGLNLFQAMLNVASHELVEMITDTQVGNVFDNYSPFIAWYNDTKGEIGDICAFNPGTYVACDGETYSIQREYSNKQGACVDFGTPTCTKSPTFKPSKTPTKSPSNKPARKHDGEKDSVNGGSSSIVGSSTQSATNNLGDSEIIAIAVSVAFLALLIIGIVVYLVKYRRANSQKPSDGSVESFYDVDTRSVASSVDHINFLECNSSTVTMVAETVI